MNKPSVTLGPGGLRSRFRGLVRVGKIIPEIWLARIRKLLAYRCAASWLSRCKPDAKS